MRVAIVQLEVVEGDKDRNLKHAIECVLKAPHADIYVLPEIWNISYFFFDGYLDGAETSSGETIVRLIDTAIEMSAYIHIGSIVEKEGSKYFNTSYLISPLGELVAQYRKIHLFGYNSQEKALLSPGRNITVAKTELGSMGMATCYDLRFPEQFRAMVRQGADFITICSAWPYPRMDDWLLLNSVRAMENQLFVISANAAGICQGTSYLGHSMVVNPWGEVIVQASDQETILFVEIDMNQVSEAREGFPAVKDFLEDDLSYWH